MKIARFSCLGFVSSFLMVVSCLHAPVGAHAQDSAQSRERGSFTIGAFITDRRSTTQLDSDEGQGTNLDLENDLGLDASMTVARLAGHYSLNPRHRLDFSFFDLSRNATRQIDETIEYGDETFLVDTLVSSDQDLAILKAAYTFVPFTRERWYLGVTGGLYTASVKLTLSEATAGTFESEDLTAPLPVIGLRGEYEITDRITFRGASEWFRIDAGDAKGRLRDTYLGVDYGFSERMAVGLAYNDVSMSIEATETGGFQGALDWGYDGFLVYFRADFGN